MCNTPQLLPVKQTLIKSVEDIVALIPVSQQYWKGSEDMIYNYQDFVSKIVKYTVEEKEYDS